MKRDPRIPEWTDDKVRAFADFCQRNKARLVRADAIASPAVIQDQGSIPDDLSTGRPTLPRET